MENRRGKQDGVILTRVSHHVRGRRRTLFYSNHHQRSVIPQPAWLLQVMTSTVARWPGADANARSQVTKGACNTSASAI